MKKQPLALLLALCLMLMSPALALAKSGAHLDPDTILTNEDLPVSGYLGFDIEMTHYEILPNYEGKPCIVIDWVFTNLSDAPQNFSDAAWVQVYQGDPEETGTNLWPTVLMEYDEVNEEEDLARLKSLPVKTMHLILNAEEDLRVIVTDMEEETMEDDLLEVTIRIGSGEAPDPNAPTPNTGTLTPLNDPDQIRTAMARHAFSYYRDNGAEAWYGETTDTERILMAQTLLTLYTSLGYDVSTYTPGTFAQALNDRFDADPTPTIWETACAETGVLAAGYVILSK